MISTTSAIEALPLLILDRICGYLDGETALRRNLESFALASKCCHSAAEGQLFRQIHFQLLDPDQLEGSLRQLRNVLAGGRYRHVRRLKISWARDETSTPSQDENTDEDGYRTGGWNLRPYIYMHKFCRPSEKSLKGYGAYSLSPRTEIWAPLGQFVSHFPGLQDLIWAAGEQIPPSILAIVLDKKCRLHHHNFRLRSMIFDRDNTQHIPLRDYAVCLHSIVLRFDSVSDHDSPIHTQETAMQIITAMAPNLRHICAIQTPASGEISRRHTRELERPGWKKLLPSGVLKGENPPSIHRNLQSLIFVGHMQLGLDFWSHSTDFSQLRCLVSRWNNNISIVLANISAKGEFGSLQKLKLVEILDESEQTQNAFYSFLSNLNPLERLELKGYVSPKAFDVIIQHHGKNLRSLLLSPEGDEELRNPLAMLSAPVMQQLACHSPFLKYLCIPISRTRGDKHEVGVYRALSQLASLEYASLKLMYTIGPDEEFWDEEKDGPHPISSELNDGGADKIPIAYLKEAFSNSALDETLASGIFDLISSKGKGRLRYLRLELVRKARRNDPGVGEGQFQDTLGWFNRSYFCTRDFDRGGKVTFKLLNTQILDAAEEHWKFLMSEEEKWYGEEVFAEAFKDLWPRKTEEWWKDWQSLPLELEEDRKLQDD